jgi:hypothetical protein
MDTMLIQLTNQKAFKLLRQLEELNLIKVLKENFGEGQNLSKKYAGKLPVEVARDMQKYVSQSRGEWEK